MGNHSQSGHVSWRQVGAIALWTLGLAILAAVLFPVFATEKSGRGHFPLCGSRLKQSALAVIMYAGDFDDRLPSAALWATRAKAYAKEDGVFVCPPAALADPKAFGHAFRRSLGGVDTATVNLPQEVPMIFDSTDLTWNANGGTNLLPLVGRNPGGKNGLAFLDGHVKFLTRQELLTAAADRHLH